ncbi:MAG: ParB/RepB/Spo0J family partition protein, partial [Candidatus Heimdallarchaeaceae archaeon]
MEIRGKNLIVSIDKIVPNDFNPKPDYNSTEELRIEFERIKNSLKNHQQIDPIIVRELPEKELKKKPGMRKKYEIINGYHRWAAMKELGVKKVEVKNLGKI